MVADSQYRFIYATASNRGEALRLGRFLVQQRLAACVNVHGGMTAVYWWDDKVEEKDEAVLIAKTTADRYEAALAAIREQHSYKCPAVIAIPIAAGLPDYLRWVHDQTHQ